jgi:hypothetical protein
MIAASVRVRDDNRGRVFIVRGGAFATAQRPPIWFAGDTGSVRSSLLRAHPIVDGGMLQSINWDVESSTCQ